MVAVLPTEARVGPLLRDVDGRDRLIHRQLVLAILWVPEVVEDVPPSSRVRPRSAGGVWGPRRVDVDPRETRSRA